MKRTCWMLAALPVALLMVPWAAAQEKKTETKTETKTEIRDENGKLISEEKTVTKTRIDEPKARAGFMEIWYAPAKRWQKASDIMGKQVKNSSGEKLGEIGELAIDVEAGRIVYGVLEFGGFLGVGEKWFAVPWSAVRLTDDSKNFMMDATKDSLKNAQGFDKKGQWPNFGDERWATENHKFYNQPRYWEMTDDSSGVYKPTSRWQKASDLLHKKVHSLANNDKLGHVTDLALDPDTGRVLYTIVELDNVKSMADRKVAIPWRGMRLSEDFDHFVIDMDKDAFTKTPSFTNDTWPKFNDRTWANENATFYHVTVYYEKDKR